jgi:hypothetical protein
MQSFDDRGPRRNACASPAERARPKLVARGTTGRILGAVLTAGIGSFVLALELVETPTFAATTITTAPPRPAFSNASGTIAAVSGSSMEVQNPTTGQVTVSWTPTTTFTQTLTVPSSQLAVGDCVTVSSTTKETNGHLKASTVALRPTSNSSCTGGAGGGGFGARTFPTTPGGSRAFRPPNGTSTGGSFPRGAFGSRSGTTNSGFASGKVISLERSTFVVQGVTIVPPKTTAKGTNSSKKKVTTTTTTVPAKLQTKTVKTTVSFSSSTAFTTTAPASSSTMSVGMCATALGPADQTGAITASTISLRSAPASGCTAAGGFAGGGFGGRFGRGGTAT